MRIVVDGGRVRDVLEREGLFLSDGSWDVVVGEIAGAVVLVSGDTPTDAS